MRTAISLLSLLLLAAAGSCSQKADPEGTPRRIAREIERALSAVALNEIARDPERASRLGLDRDQTDYPFANYLNDRSQAAYERARLSRLETRDLLVSLSRPARGSALARHLDTVIAAHETAETLSFAGHGTVSLGIAHPYVADHLNGAWVEIPTLLSRFHPLNTAEDAAAFVDRMAKWADAIDDERRRLQADAASGITPPAAVLHRMHQHAAALTPPMTSPVLERFATLLPTIPELGLPERTRLLENARRIVEEQVEPAYARLSDVLIELAASAPEAPGIWQLPGGDAYYAEALRAHTGDPGSAAGLFETGRREVIARLGELDRILAETGLAEGSVAQRLRQLSGQAEQNFPQTPEGRAELIGRLMAHAERAQPLIREQFADATPGPVTIRARPDDGAPARAGAEYVPEARNATAPANLDLDLDRPEDWPDYRLAALAFEYISPGRHLGSQMAFNGPEPPLIRRLIQDPAYSAGWAAYAASLADEAGLYASEPLSRVGYLQSVLLHAAHLVADIGIHRMRWSREEAVSYLVETTGISEEAAAETVDRICVQPGSGAAAWLARQRFLDLRERAIRVLGPRFDPQAFHGIILSGGPRPLSIVDEDITRWYTEQIQN